MTEIRALLVHSGPELEVELLTIHPRDFLATAYAKIGCRAVDCASSPEGIDVWCDDEGLLVAEPELNVGASGLVGRPIYGHVILARCDDEGETVSLTDEELQTFLDARPTETKETRPMTNPRRTFWFDQTHEEAPGAWTVNLCHEHDDTYRSLPTVVTAGSYAEALVKLEFLNELVFGHDADAMTEIVMSGMFQGEIADEIIEQEDRA